jgi:hypothetical protein
VSTAIIAAIVLASTSLQPIGVKSIFVPSFVPMYCAYHGQILGNTKNLHDAHCITETSAIDADIPTIDRQSQVGM